jgi:hypothetical protein
MLRSDPRALPSLGLAVLGVACLASFGASCNLDPVQSSAVKDLGPEIAEAYAPESAFHRPGEPCAVCHSKNGPASDSPFVLGGTIFWGPKSYDRRVDGAYVRIRDATKTTKCFVTNCNGNFFVRPKDFERLTFPLLVSVERTVDPYDVRSKRLVFKEMGGHIGREPSCANCHNMNFKDFASPGQIYMYGSEEQVDTLKPPITTPCPNPDKPPVLECPEDRL